MPVLWETRRTQAQHFVGQWLQITQSWSQMPVNCPPREHDHRFGEPNKTVSDTPSTLRGLPHGQESSEAKAYWPWKGCKQEAFWGCLRASAFLLLFVFLALRIEPWALLLLGYYWAKSPTRALGFFKVSPTHSMKMSGDLADLSRWTWTWAASPYFVYCYLGSLNICTWNPHRPTEDEAFQLSLMLASECFLIKSNFSDSSPVWIPCLWPTALLTLFHSKNSKRNLIPSCSFFLTISSYKVKMPKDDSFYLRLTTGDSSDFKGRSTLFWLEACNINKYVLFIPPRMSKWE